MIGMSFVVVVNKLILVVNKISVSVWVVRLLVRMVLCG